jgi:5-methylcytosine-specific restriction protein A
MALRTCRYPNCPGVAVAGSGGYCADHQGRRKAEPARKPTGHAGRIYDSERWRKLRRSWLQRYPLCVSCMVRGTIRPAVVVDHIVRHRGDPGLAWSPENFQGLCTKCHNSKTNVERGGGKWR